MLQPDVHIGDPRFLAPELPLELVHHQNGVPGEGDESRREALTRPYRETGEVAYVCPGEEEEGVGAPRLQGLAGPVSLLLVEVGHRVQYSDRGLGYMASPVHQTMRES